MTIAFGIAVDDTIHVFNRLKLEAKQNGGQLNKEVVVATMTRISPALVTTTAILSSGLITVLWSDMPMIEYFGLLCVATFVLALLADVLLLPGLIVWSIGFTEKGEARPNEVCCRPCFCDLPVFTANEPVCRSSRNRNRLDCHGGNMVRSWLPAPE